MTYSTLVLGGARSGKSGHAEQLLPTDRDVTYVATARRDPTDPDWTRRIETHVNRRPSTWHTVEPAPAELAGLLVDAGRDDLLLVDDLATWLTGVLDDVGAWEGGTGADRYAAELVAAVADCRARLVLVSAEVGLGVVPQTRSGRLFRDELGSLNAGLGAVCDEVLLLVAGIAVTLKNLEVGR